MNGLHGGDDLKLCQATGIFSMDDLNVFNTVAQAAYNVFAALLYAWNRAQHRW